MDDVTQMPEIPSEQPPKTNSSWFTRERLLVLAAGIVLLLAVVLAVAKLVDKNEPTTQPDTSTVLPAGAVTITKDGFSPATIRVAKGQSVTWTNNDTAFHQVASDPHPTHTGLADLQSDPLDKNDSFTFTFDQVGTYTYHDESNPLTFKATVIVE